MNRKYFIWVFVISLFIGVILLINSTSYEIDTPNSEQDIIDNCENLELFDTAKCLNDNINTFYKFNKTDDALIQAFNNLKIRGGDCMDYSRLYEKLGNKLGFTSKIVRISLTKIDHVFTIINDGEDYCILDQNEYWCKNLK